jgi:Mrp family chromosome partitioning ATPase/capsular polysaccharide biosynthesis protein
MANVNSSGGAASSWLGPDSEGSDLRRHLLTLRHRGWLIAVTVVLALIVAVIYVKTATPTYQASSNLLVTSVPSGGSIPTNLPGLLYQSNDPTRDIQTAANVVDSMTTAKAVKAALRLRQPAATILKKITVQPVSDSNVLAITGTSDTAAGAAALANSFAQQTIAIRTAMFRRAVAQQITSLKAETSGTTGASTTGAANNASPAQQLTQLQTLRNAAVPDMSVSAQATPPTGRTSPRAGLSLGAALVVGLVVGILGVLALEAFDLTLRREDQLKALFRLPILARVPHEGDRRRWGLRQTSEPRTPDSLTFPTLEAFRTLRAMALASRSPGQPVPRSLLVTSAAPGEGKTTTALNLASSLVASGSSVILIEGDLRKPSIGNAVGITARYDVTSVVTGEAPLESALVTSDRYPGLQFLLAEGIRSKGTSGDALFLPTATKMVRDAKEVADFVIVDSPPLLAVIDALELAREADSVLIVAHLGHTDLRRLSALGSLLAEAHIDPAGIALIGAAAPGGTEVYGYHQPPRGGGRGAPASATRGAAPVEDPLAPETSRRSRRHPPGGPDRAGAWP